METLKKTVEFEALFRYATEGILVVNETGEIVRINPSAEKLFGYDLGELIGNKIEVLVPRQLAEKHQRHRDGFNVNPHARAMGSGFDLKGLRKDGSEFPVEISLSPYSGPEGKFVIAFIVDITARKQAEEKIISYSADLEKQVRNRTLILEEAVDELEKTKADLKDALEKEKELNELKSRFVSMASHEFRTPLATILSSLSLVTRYGEMNEKEKQTKHIVRIKSAINNLTDILNDFLSVSKLEEGKVEYNPEKFDIGEFIAPVVTEMQGLAKANQKIVGTYPVKGIVNLDKKLLKNILFNLISNAIKFSPEGKSIEVEALVEATSVILKIKDQGMGITKEDQEHLFERFFRARNATNIQGTGLGLNIVLKYVELMNGKIDFESRENKGTTFILTFPQ